MGCRVLGLTVEVSSYNSPSLAENYIEGGPLEGSSCRYVLHHAAVVCSAAGQLQRSNSNSESGHSVDGKRYAAEVTRNLPLNNAITLSGLSLR